MDTGKEKQIGEENEKDRGKAKGKGEKVIGEFGYNDISSIKKIVT